MRGRATRKVGRLARCGVERTLSEPLRHVVNALRLPGHREFLRNPCTHRAQQVANNAAAPFYLAASRLWFECRESSAIVWAHWPVWALPISLSKSERRSDDPGSQHPGRRRQSVHAQDRAQSPDEYRRAQGLRGERRHRRARRHSHRVARTSCILDWELPLLNGAEFVRIVRSPGVFPMSDVPIIMLSVAWRALARGRGGADRRQRVSAQAGLRAGTA